MFKTKTDPEADERHSYLEKAVPVTGPREAHATTTGWGHVPDAAPRATPKPPQDPTS